MSEPIAIDIDIRTPEKWIARHFWVGRRRRVFGIVVAFCPTFFALGVELMAGKSKGAAIIIGPVWLGFATLKITTPTPHGDPE